MTPTPTDEHAHLLGIVAKAYQIAYDGGDGSRAFTSDGGPGDGLHDHLRADDRAERHRAGLATAVAWVMDECAPAHAPADTEGFFSGPEDGLSSAFQESSRVCVISRDADTITLTFPPSTAADGRGGWAVAVMHDYLAAWLRRENGTPAPADAVGHHPSSER
jgi:hypothetical protein